MNQATHTTTTCPECSGKTTKVKPITIESLVTDEARATLTNTAGFRFCPSAECETAYVQPETGLRILKDQVKVRIGQKETCPSRQVCYCFSHTVEEIEAEVATTGTSALADAITAKCRQGLDRCPETNPQGRCCLGNVRAAVKAAQEAAPAGPEAEASNAPSPTDEAAHGCCSGEEVEQETTSPGVDVATAAAKGDSCCASNEATPPKLEEAAPGKKVPLGELLATGGALVSAVLSSACCWLPLLLIGFGLSAGSVASAFEAYRPALLGVTGLFLAGGFYLTYFRKEKCEPDSACATPNRKLVLFNKISLWVATVAVAGFAFFPNYVGAFLSDGGELAPPPATTEALDVVKLDIEGMTCEACEVSIAAELKKVQGMRQVKVSFKERLATLHVVSGTNSVALIQAVEAAGYKGRVRSSEAANPTQALSQKYVVIDIEGMTCEACAVGITAELKKVSGVSNIRVSFEKKQASLLVPPSVDMGAVLRAVESAGYKGEIRNKSE